MWDRYLLEGCTIFNTSPYHPFIRYLARFWCGPKTLKGWVAGWFYVCGTVGVMPLYAAELPALQFSIKPRICVLTDAEQTCYDQLVVKWTAAEKMNLCLYQTQLPQPIKCWSKTQQGEHKFQLTADHSVTFQLREFNQTTLASEHFEVIHQRGSFRRQRRNPWSFF